MFHFFLFDRQSQFDADDASVGSPLEAALLHDPLPVVHPAVADLHPRGVPVRRLDGDDVFLRGEIGMKFVAAVPGSSIIKTKSKLHIDKVFIGRSIRRYIN